MRSIRFFLISSILAVLVLFNFVAALQGYQSSMLEADRLFDNQMLDLARLVSNQDFSTSEITEVRLGNDLTFQVWEQGQLLAASRNAPLEPIHDFSPGFDFANFNGYRWRSYSRFDALHQRWVIIAERTDLRFVLAENVVLQSVLPMLLGIPLVGLLIWIIVTHGLRPLRELTSELKKKTGSNLSPFLYANSRVELDQLIESTNGFIQRLAKAMEREKRFSADAAHELRTPISALKVQLHNLGLEIDTTHDSYQALQLGVGRMQHLLEQLLSLYRTTPEQFDANCKAIDLYAITQRQVASMYPQFEAKQQQVELFGEAAFIEADEFAITTLLSNLLSNANKYTQTSGTICIRVDTVNGRVCLKVEDNGPGIDEQDRSRVFDRFYRGHTRSDATNNPGCGLGLTIVSHIAELHNANLELTSSSFNTGSAFIVCFNKAG